LIQIERALALKKHQAKLAKEEELKNKRFMTLDLENQCVKLDSSASEFKQDVDADEFMNDEIQSNEFRNDEFTRNSTSVLKGNEKRLMRNMKLKTAVQYIS
jgi:hypothetical protein